MNGIDSNGQFLGFDSLVDETTTTTTETAPTTIDSMQTLSRTIDEITDSITKLVSCEDLERLRTFSGSSIEGSGQQQEQFKSMLSTTSTASGAATNTSVAATSNFVANKRFKSSAAGANNSTTNDNRSDKFLRPFEHGWKRELVYRAFSDPKQPKRNGEVYYYTPNGKKLRSLREIQEHIRGTLEIDCFSFSREPIGVGAAYETVRDAKNFRVNKHVRDQKSYPVVQSGGGGENCDQPPVVSNMLKNDLQAAQTLSSLPKKSGGGGGGDGAKALKSIETRQNGIGGASCGGGLQSTASIDRNLFKQCLVSIGDKRFIMVPKNVPSAKHRFPTLPTLLASTTHASPATTLAISNSNSNNRSSKTKPLSKRTKSSIKMPENLLNRSNTMFNALQKVFEYLPLVDVCRAAQVCRLWQAVSTQTTSSKNNRNSRLSNYWTHLKIPKNVTITNCANFLLMLNERHTESIDLRNMLTVRARCETESNARFWSTFESLLREQPEATDESIRLRDLRHFYANCCPGTFPYRFVGCTSKLQTLSCGIQSEILTIPTFARFENLVKLRLKSSSGESFTLKCENFASFKQMRFLKHFALSLVRDLRMVDLESLMELRVLEQLEIGECVTLADEFVTEILAKMPALKRLRLEKLTGEQTIVNRMLKALVHLPHLIQLELINVDVRAGFDLAVGPLLAEKLQKFLIVPTYVTQAATTNHLILNTIITMATPSAVTTLLATNQHQHHNSRRCLSKFTWVVTTELLHVTQLFVNDCNSFESTPQTVSQTQNGIPILKPLPSILALSDTVVTGDCAPEAEQESVEVEIVSLDRLERSLTQLLRNTTVSVCKVPCSSTWEHSI